MVAAHRPIVAVLALVAVVALSGCELLFVGATDPPVAPATTEEVSMIQEPGGERFPDVLEVRLEPTGDRTYDVFVTLSSPYDTPQRYADGWQVADPGGNVLGTHTLLHDHAAEQPFTRVQRGLVIAQGIDEVTVQGRDQANGFGGLSLTVAVPASS